ncbi:MAG: S16 family serine protease [Dysosmobacter sp.]
MLGPSPIPPPLHTEREEIGVVNGLAWTEAGGEILDVEVNVMEGSGKLELTGNLGDVMKESAQAALSCLRSRCGELGIPADFYKTKDIHIHFPEGAVPKDGPSAGIAITTALLSALTGRKIRAGIAMTGEVTLRGRVLPIGGLKEKTMAALRYGVETVLIPRTTCGIWRTSTRPCAKLCTSSRSDGGRGVRRRPLPPGGDGGRSPPRRPSPR